MPLIEKNWKIEFDTYMMQTEPSRTEKSELWQVAIGLQQVDGLSTSDYLLNIAKEHIEGKITIGEVQHRLILYYKDCFGRMDYEDETREADLVAARITELLGEQTFQFSPKELQIIHRRLFSDILLDAGTFRTYNISKKEWILEGKSVLYASWQSIPETLDYDFQQEKNFSYESLSTQESIAHFAKFAAGIWQIHPFCEGNTRTTAIFLIRYLRTFGFAIGSTAFKNDSWYFRNALVRANYTDMLSGIHATTAYLERFLQNLLLGTNHPLQNRDLHINAKTSSANINRV